MSRFFISKKCSRKNPAIEYLLSDNRKYFIKPPTISVIEGNKKTENYFIGRGGIINYMKDGDAIAIRIEEPGPHAHSIIVVKSKFLKEGWSIFDPNGKIHIPFRIYNDDDKDVSNKYLEVTGENVINTGNDTYNPGYCGIFGIIFLAYFKAHYSNDNWVKNWNKIYKVLEKRLEGKGRGTIGVDFAAKVQDIINNSKEGDTRIILQILNDLNAIMNEGITKTPSRTKTPTRTKTPSRTKRPSRTKTPTRTKRPSRTKKSDKKGGKVNRIRKTIKKK